MLTTLGAEPSMLSGNPHDFARPEPMVAEGMYVPRASRYAARARIWSAVASAMSVLFRSASSIARRKGSGSALKLTPAVMIIKRTQQPCIRFIPVTIS